MQRTVSHLTEKLGCGQDKRSNFRVVHTNNNGLFFVLWSLLWYCQPLQTSWETRHLQSSPKVHLIFSHHTSSVCIKDKLLSFSGILLFNMCMNDFHFCNYFCCMWCLYWWHIKSNVNIVNTSLNNSVLW